MPREQRTVTANGLEFACLTDGPEDGPLALTSNFRSVPGILEFANECFGTLMGESYSRLEPVRPAGGTESPVRLVGRALADGLRRSLDYYRQNLTAYL